jgi:SAM-dependent methyltransferase
MASDDYNVVSTGYDAVYAAKPNSPTLRRIWREHVMGDDFPEDFEHISFVSLDDLERVARDAKISGRPFGDLACGTGGPGLWIARETRGALHGIDLSPVGISLARERAKRVGIEARFSVGSFAKTGLPSESLDGAISIDAFQYAPSKAAGLTELARVLRSGARLVMFAFELDPKRSAGLPLIEADPVPDYRPLLQKAGFRVLSYEQTPQWRERLEIAYRAIVGARHELAQEMGTSASAALLMETSLTLDRQPYSGRVLFVAEKSR